MKDFTCLVCSERQEILFYDKDKAKAVCLKCGALNPHRQPERLDHVTKTEIFLTVIFVMAIFLIAFKTIF